MQIWQKKKSKKTKNNNKKILKWSKKMSIEGSAIIKDYKVFMWKSKVLQVILSRRIRTIPNKESWREGIRE